MAQPYDIKKEACDRLAGLLHAGGGLEIARLFQLTGFLGPELESSSDWIEAPLEKIAGAILTKYLGDAPAPIGIWKPRESKGETTFVRDDSAPTSDWWPPQRVLEPKKSLLPLRICLLGESTAAGWFYAPALTPAQVLAEQLRAVRPGIYEVIDLTMVNLRPTMLADLTGAVLQLTPDILVIFAGNNWPMRLPSYPGARLADSQAAAAALREAGLAGLARFSAGRTRENAEKALAIISRVADARGVPVVLVVPEANLGDWARHRPVAWLPGGESAEWHALHQRALELLRKGEYESAAEIANRMIGLDGGSCPTSHALRGQALVGLGRFEEARECYRKQVDSRGWDNFPSTPSATPVVQDALRQGAKQHEMSLVDLPAVFREHVTAGTPGRRLFLDYCHLNVEGMKVAMAAVTSKLLALSDPQNKADVDWRYLVATLPNPEVRPQTDAAVKFMTALYNIHYGSAYDPLSGSQMSAPGSVARHWLEAALQAWPGIEDIMLAYVTTRSVPSDSFHLSAELERFHEAISSLERQTAHNEALEPELVEVICELLERSGRSVREAAYRPFQANHGVGRKTIDLVQPAYHWSVIERYQDRSGFGDERCLFYRARWPVSHFCLVSDTPAEIQLELIARLPRLGEVVIVLNDSPVATIELSERWTRCAVRLNGENLRPGFNRVSLRWPDLPAQGDKAIRGILERLERGIPTDLHPVFGEVFRFEAATPAL